MSVKAQPPKFNLREQIMNYNKDREDSTPKDLKVPPSTKYRLVGNRPVDRSRSRNKKL